MIYKEALPIACTTMDSRDSRENVLKEYAFDYKLYDQEDIDRHEQEQTLAFKIIQDVDRQRRHILDNLLLQLERHECLSSQIKRARDFIMDDLEDEFMDEDNSRQNLGYYEEAFYIEKYRCIKVVEKHLDEASHSFDGFRQTLNALNKLPRHIEFHREKQIRLCIEMSHTCNNWHCLLLQQEFSDSKYKTKSVKPS